CKYVPGDDTRRLDWRAWGRSDRFYIKEYEADTNLRLCLVIDVSGSMNFGKDGSREPGRSKLDYARRLAGTLAYLAAGQGDAVGLYCAGPSFQKEIRPKRSGAHLRYVLDELAGLQAEGETGLPTALHECAERVAQRALIVVISDLFFDPEQLRSSLQHLRFRKHDVAVFHLLEQNEIDFQFDRPVRFVDLEGAGPMLVDPTTIAKQYRKAVQDWLESLKRMVRDTAIDYHRVSIDENYADVLARFLLARKR
ncbi:MAG: DUF58 domain-containing protein, partial [Planctomycetaceae bacterium]|nr:DUF58 domain-containing protein [Planctomycetaceae bacterium]